MYKWVSGSSLKNERKLARAKKNQNCCSIAQFKTRFVWSKTFRWLCVLSISVAASPGDIWTNPKTLGEVEEKGQGTELNSRLRTNIKYCASQADCERLSEMRRMCMKWKAPQIKFSAMKHWRPWIDLLPHGGREKFDEIRPIKEERNQRQEA